MISFIYFAHFFFLLCDWYLFVNSVFFFFRAAHICFASHIEHAALSNFKRKTSERHWNSKQNVLYIDKAVTTRMMSYSFPFSNKYFATVGVRRFYASILMASLTNFEETEKNKRFCSDRFVLMKRWLRLRDRKSKVGTEKMGGAKCWKFCQFEMESYEAVF